MIGKRENANAQVSKGVSISSFPISTMWSCVKIPNHFEVGLWGWLMGWLMDGLWMAYGWLMDGVSPSYERLHAATTQALAGAANLLA